MIPVNKSAFHICEYPPVKIHCEYCRSQKCLFSAMFQSVLNLFPILSDCCIHTPQNQYHSLVWMFLLQKNQINPAVSPRFFLQISVTCSISSDIGIVFMYRPSSHHQEQSLSSSLVIDLSIADYFLKNNIQSLPAHRHLFHINAILSNMYDSIILRKAFFSCIMCND